MRFYGFCTFCMQHFSSFLPGGQAASQRLLSIRETHGHHHRRHRRHRHPPLQGQTCHLKDTFHNPTRSLHSLRAAHTRQQYKLCTHPHRDRCSHCERSLSPLCKICTVYSCDHCCRGCTKSKIAMPRCNPLAESNHSECTTHGYLCMGKRIRCGLGLSPFCMSCISH